MDNIMHEYTAGELLDWLADEELDQYIEQEIEEYDGESHIIDVLDVERVKTNFMLHKRRYVTIVRGYKVYIHDNQTCDDIMSYKFNDNTREEIMNNANIFCENLNSRKVSFIGKKYRCD